MRKYLGFICLLYFGIIVYVFKEEKIKYFLSPSMAVYLKCATVILFILAIFVFLNKKFKYKFKLSDLVLFVPLVMLMFTSNCTFSSSFAVNRMNISKKGDKNSESIKIDKTTDSVLEEETLLWDDLEKDDELSKKAYFEIDDSLYDYLGNYLTYVDDAKVYKNRTIKVRGFAVINNDAIPNNYFAIGKYSITCCAADASFTGFMVKNDLNFDIVESAWYEIYGILEEEENNYYHVLRIKPISIKEIDESDEEYYVYPCYYYNSCEKLARYNSN